MRILKRLKFKIYSILKERDKFNNFRKDFLHFKSQNQRQEMSCEWNNIYPCLDDKTETTGFDAHYVYHPAWAARIIKSINPKKHVDISSTLHFCSMLSAFIPVDFYDYRPVNLSLENLRSLKGDLMDLNFEDNSLHSISCMHTIEHIGLGRYGDRLDPDGDLKAISELKRVCAKNGNLILVVPVGIPKILFNAHRIYNPEKFISYLDGFKLKEFSLVTDNQNFITNASFELAGSQKYGCGCFWFTKE